MKKQPMHWLLGAAAVIAAGVAALDADAGPVTLSLSTGPVASFTATQVTTGHATPGGSVKNTSLVFTAPVAQPPYTVQFASEPSSYLSNVRLEATIPTDTGGVGTGPLQTTATLHRSAGPAVDWFNWTTGAKNMSLQYAGRTVSGSCTAVSYVVTSNTSASGDEALTVSCQKVAVTGATNVALALLAMTDSGRATANSLTWTANAMNFNTTKGHFTGFLLDLSVEQATMYYDANNATGTAAVATQEGWRYCNKCQGLVFAGGQAGHCPAGGTHTASGGNYVVAKDNLTPDYQNKWSWCSKCQQLAFTGGGNHACAGGGLHNHAGSGSYGVLMKGASGAQSGWKFCNKCGTLVFSGSSNAGKCAGGGGHDVGSSGAYFVAQK